jgi:hypothetical protein
MIKQLGAKGMIFFTFSAADMHWPDLHQLMPHGENENPIDVESDEDRCKHRRQDLINNPHIAAWFFDKRFETFLKTVLIPKWRLEDYWYRYEWQHRGSVHVHGIGIMRDAPLFDWDNMKDNEDEMSRILSHFDSLVTTINPYPDAPVPVRHPCQKANDELCDDLQDYIELVNKLQKHTRCSPSYCLRTKNGQQYCRFGFPKDNVEHSFIHENDRGQPELITSRNDPYVNSHNRVQLQGWRANVDLKPVLNIHAALQYVAKYATKSEPRSSFSEILNKILSESDPSGSSLPSFQRLLLHTVSERGYSAQETCHLLLGLPLYHSSRTFVILNLNNESHRWLCGTEIENVMPNSDVGRTERSPVQKYWDRPVELENLSMFQLYLGYKFYNGKWKRCEREDVVHIWPRPSPQRNGPQWNEFCRIKVILHVSHRSLEQLTENNSLS